MALKQIIAVASGKGGVGKSSVAVNLAITLGRDEFACYPHLGPGKVCLIDVDFYGPSVPTLMGGGEIAFNDKGGIIPANRYGIKYVSIAFFLKNPDDPVIWRGPMFGKGISQLFNEVDWGQSETCIVDLPPGTGDAQLSLSQMMSLSGAIVVTTPQEVALSDVRRAINMFRKVNVPLLGIVENMTGLTLPTGERIDLFGSGGGAQLAAAYDLPLIGEIPFIISLRQGGDSGKPAAASGEGEAFNCFSKIASNLITELGKQEQNTVKIAN